MSEVRKITDPFTGKQVEISERLIDRLNGKYAVGPTLPNGEPEFGWRYHEVPPIQKEAAATISRLTAERDGLATQIDVLESNARVQAKLLADTGRQRNALVEAAKDLLLAIDDDEVVAGMGVGTGIAYRVSFKSFVERLRYAATSGLSDAEQRGGGRPGDPCKCGAYPGGSCDGCSSPDAEQGGAR